VILGVFFKSRELKIIKSNKGTVSKMEKEKENKRAKMESEFDVKDIIVIDNGADTVKIGISGEDKPRVIRICICY